MLVIRATRLTNNQTATIHQFFADSDNCTVEKCFLGIVPDETHTTDMDDLFGLTSMVESYQLRLIEIQIRHLEWQWSSTQPHFMQTEGFIAFSAGLETDLYLGDMLATFGTPDTITNTVFNAYMHYPQHGFSLKVPLNCAAVWYSPVTVLYRLPATIPIETATLPETVHRHCHRYSRFP